MPAKSSISPLPFNPAILRWARNRADFSHAEVAKKINVKPQKIIDWENKESTPTVRQARDMAALYGRPFLEFFALEVPDIPETNLVPDFRMQHSTPIDHENKILRDVQAWGETQRLNTIDLFEINGDTPPTFPKELRAVLTDNQERAAEFARSVLKFPIEQQLSMRSYEKLNLVKIIRSKLEEIGILILKNSDLGKCNARGLCIYNELLPVIILSSETPNGSSFTLCHEFAHVILRQSAVSDVVAKSSNQVNITEQWCNRFAGAFLMPYKYLVNYIDPTIKLQDISDNALKGLANRFAVSMHAMLVRLVQLNIVEGDYYWLVKRPQFLEEEKKKQIARSVYYGSRYRNRNGDMYTGLVLDAWANNRISNHNAAEFMGITNLTHLFEIRNRFNDRE